MSYYSNNNVVVTLTSVNGVVRRVEEGKKYEAVSKDFKPINEFYCAWFEILAPYLKNFKWVWVDGDESFNLGWSFSGRVYVLSISDEFGIFKYKNGSYGEWYDFIDSAPLGVGHVGCLKLLRKCFGNYARHAVRKEGR